MKQLLLYANSNWYENDLKLAKTVSESNGAVPADFTAWKERFREGFQEKEYVSIYILEVDIHIQEGRVDIITNEYGTHPLKVRLEINAPKRKKESPNLLFPSIPAGTLGGMNPLTGPLIQEWTTQHGE